MVFGIGIGKDKKGIKKLLEKKIGGELPEESIEVNQKTVIIKQGTKGITPEFCENQLRGKWVDGVGCVIEEIPLGDRVKLLSTPNVAVVGGEEKRELEE